MRKDDGLSGVSGQLFFACGQLINSVFSNLSGNYKQQSTDKEQFIVYTFAYDMVP
jgi:hypothetical protein